MNRLTQDLRYVLRSLTREKTFWVVSLLTLALCTGANTAIFSLINAVLLRPLPYPEPERLVTVYNMYPRADIPKASASPPNYADRKQATDIFEELALVEDSSFNVGSDDSSERILGLAVTPSYFRTLRVSPRLGRTFREEEAKAGHGRVVVLSHGLWIRMFAGDPSILGRDVRLSDVAYQVIGVMPAAFKLVTGSPQWDRDVQAWVPLVLTEEQLSDDHLHSNNFLMIGRLQRGVTLAQAQAKVDAINRAAAERVPRFRDLAKNSGFGTKVTPLHEDVVESVRTELLLLQGAVLVVLLIGCVNVANLLLVRSSARLKELAVRSAIGAGRWALARLLIVEGVVLGVLGGALGIIVGFGGVHLLRTVGAELLPRGADVRMDVWVLGFSIGVSVLAGLLFSVIPAANVVGRDLNEALRQTGRSGTTDRKALMTRGALVVAQVSLAFVLLIGAGLLIASFRLVLDINPGFRSERVLTAKVSLPRSRYGDDEQVRTFISRAFDEIRAMPGVINAGLNHELPFSGDGNQNVTTIVGYTLKPGELPPVPSWHMIDEEYFLAMGIPLLEGRTFEARDTAEAPKVVIVDEFLARKYWQDSPVLGGQLRMDYLEEASVYTVVGVVGSVRKTSLDGAEVPGIVYFPYRQLNPRTFNLVVKTAMDEVALITPLRAAIRRVDSSLPLFDVKSMDARLDESLVAREAILGLSMLFAFLALLLSAIGIYGVLAYAVAQRTQEIGIRVALGAQRADVIRMITGRGLALAGLGLAIGLLGAQYLTGVLSGLLYGIQPTDGTVFVAVSIVLVIAALLASVVPTVRALRVDPMTALRYE